MSDLVRLRRAGEGALRYLVDRLPDVLPTEHMGDWDPRSGSADVCLVFVDVAGYSDFVAAAGDDAALAVLAVLDRRARRALGRRRGARIVKRLGDGLMIAARRPSDALGIAVAMVRDFDRAAVERGWPLRLRAGVHRGTARRRGDDYFGYHVNVAARVAEAAAGGRVLASPHALAGVDLAGLGLAAAASGTLLAKGVNGPLELFRVREEVPGTGGAALHGGRLAS